MHRSLSLLAVLGLSPLLFAQIEAAVAQSFGVSRRDGVVCAGGPDYSARFVANGMTYTALPRRRGLPGPSLRFALRTVERGGEQLLMATGEVAPHVEDKVVSYRHSRGVTENYDVRVDGIEQTFVFATKPPGRGDLVVQAEITTDLRHTVTNDGGVRFEHDDGGGVTFGAVTGIDANGRTARGALRVDGGTMQLSLPAAFVESAAYPLVLDPFVSSAFSVGDGPNGVDGNPAVAFDLATGRYLVAWAVPISTGSADIRAQLVSGSGTPVGSQMLLGTGFLDSHPGVASVRATGRFLVSWSKSTSFYPEVVAVAVTPATGAVSSTVQIDQSPGAVDGTVAVGGDSRIGIFGTAQRALVVFRDYSALGSTIRANLVLVPSSGDPVPAASSPTLATSTFRLDDIAVSTDAGIGGKWLVAFGQSLVSISSPMTRIYGQLIDTGGNLCGTPVLISNGGAAADLRGPKVATRDGAEFVVVFEDAVASFVKLRRCVWTGSCANGSWTLDPLLTPIQQSGGQHAPAIAFAKDKWLLAWQQTVGSMPKVYTKGLDPVSCAACGREDLVELGLATDRQAAVASRWSGGDVASDQALVAWSNNTIRGRLWEARGTGTVVGLGGGCGNLGVNDYATYEGAPVLGDGTFAVELLNPTAPTLALVVGFSQANTPCGPCTMVPSMDILLAGTSPTAIPIPCDANLIGVDLFTQWVQYRASGCPILPVGLSNCLKFTIGE